MADVLKMDVAREFREMGLDYNARPSYAAFNKPVVGMLILLRHACLFVVPLGCLQLSCIRCAAPVLMLFMI